MGEIPQDPNQDKPDKKRPHLTIVSDADVETARQNNDLAYERLIASALLSDSYDNNGQRIKDVVDELSGGELSRLRIQNTAADRQAIHVLNTVLSSLHIMDTNDHKRVIGQLVDEAAAMVRAAEESADDSIEKKRHLKDRSSDALFEDYPDTNLVRTFDEIHDRHILEDEVFAQAYLLAGLVLVVAEEKYSSTTGKRWH